MSYSDQLERLLGDASRLGRGCTAYASSALSEVPPHELVACTFDFEPRLRYARYVAGFNRILDRYTNFNFDIAYIQNHCIHVGFYAQNFSDSEKNLVRRQIRKLLTEYDVVRDFNIAEVVVFGKHRYSTRSLMAATASDEDARAEKD